MVAGMLARPGLLYRAALEGATLSLYAGLQRMVALGLAPVEVRLVGGGSHNRLWVQMVADVFGVPVRCVWHARAPSTWAGWWGGGLMGKVCRRAEGSVCRWCRLRAWRGRRAHM